MAKSVRMDSEFVAMAEIHARVESRSVPKQIEYWAKIGKAMEDNPDLTYDFVRRSLLSSAENSAGKVTPYRRKNLRK